MPQFDQETMVKLVSELRRNVAREIIKFYPLNSEMHPEQKKSYQAMTPEQKLQVALDLYYSAREIKTAGLKSQHPDWTEDTIRQKVREIFLYART